MQTQRLMSWTKKAFAGALTALMLAIPTSQVLAATVPDIYWSYATPTSFNPTNGESSKIYWFLSADTATVEVEIYDAPKVQGGSKVMDLIGPNPMGNVPNPVVWAGRGNNGLIVPNGTYYYYVTADNSAGHDEWSGPIQVVGGDDGGGGDTGTAPNLSDDKVSPNPFDPNTESTSISYDLNTEADVWVTIKDGSQTVRQLFRHENSGGNDLAQLWNGRNSSNQIVAEKTYSYQIFASNANGSDTETGTVTVEFDDGGGDTGTAPNLSDDKVFPNPFDPNTESTSISYDLNTEADVWVTIKDGSQTVRQLFRHENSGGNDLTQLWNGRNTSNQIVAEKTYTYEIFASNNSGSDTETGTVTVEFDDGGTGGDEAPQITNISVDPNPFDPDVEDTTLTYTVDQCVEVNVQVRDGNNNVVVELADDTTCRSAGTYMVNWDGENSSNNQVAEGTYTFRIVATNSNGTDLETRTVFVDFDGSGGTGEGPDITEHFADPEVFDPTEGEETNIFFRIDEDADVTVEILDGSVMVDTLVNDAHANEGLSFVEWDGRDSGNDIVDDNVYTYRITACDKQDSTDCDVAAGNVEVDTDGDGGGGSGDDMEITNDFADPDRFDPEEENTHVFFTINLDAEVTVEILDDDNDVIRTLLDETNRADGSHAVTWNGEDRFGDEVDDGNYEYRITACEQGDLDDCDTATGDIEVDRDFDSDDDLISNLDVNNAVFDPRRGEESEVCFDVNHDDTEITVEILDNNRVIEELEDGREFDEQDDLCFEWDGRDEDGRIVSDDVYEYRVRAERGNDTEVEFAFTEVDTDGSSDGFDDEFCAGFYDVPRNSPFCRAIELMKIRGIFSGYPDGTFRPYADINRAEAVKVVLLAHNYNILPDDGTNLGYWDVIPRSWYMPFLRTAQREGVATGYPDGSFRPGGTINRVELLRVFLEASNINIPHCNVQPYPDTPIDHLTRWYIDYACFAKAYGLMTTDALGNFNPGAPMSRADVAMLFYQFERRGLYGGYNQNYYNSYYNSFDPNYYYAPGYGYTYDPFSYYYDDYYYNPVDPDDDDLFQDELIDDIDVEDQVFDPDTGERAEICFDILEDDTDISIDVLDDDRDRIRELVDEVEYDESNNRCFSWNGRDEDNDIVRDGDYEFRIEANRGSERQVEYADVEVDT